MLLLRAWGASSLAQPRSYTHCVNFARFNHRLLGVCVTRQRRPRAMDNGSQLLKHATGVIADHEAAAGAPILFLPSSPLEAL